MEQNKSHRRWRLAVDVGGTFIDFALVNIATGDVHIEKQPSNPATLVDEFLVGLGRLPVELDDIDLIVHGTTHGLNALVQETGAVTGLLTTRGFRDVLQIGRAARVDMYDPHFSPKEPLVPRSRIEEVSERFDASGHVIVPLSLEDVDAAADSLVQKGVQAIAISFLHSYRSPEHEQAAAKRILERYPDLTVTCSSDLTREWREFERTSTAVSNAFIQTGFARYTKALQQRLREAGFLRDIVFVQSNGGTLPASTAAAQPVRTLNSGPAGGIMGASDIARRLGLDNVVATDVGGTTYDVGLILNGQAQERSITTINGRPILAPSTDIISIGAGGGSIAQIDELTGGLRVGPESAGATPGPASFGKGGILPTVTDCQVQLGHLDPEHFLETRMKLDLDAAAEAIRTRIADVSGIDLDAAADGALEVAEANMANAIRRITTERGLDPTEFTMISYGGGGGLFAAAVSENLGIRRVVVPPHPAAFSAWGMLSSGYREDRTATLLRSLTESSVPAILDDLNALVEDAKTQLGRYGLDPASALIVRTLDVRYTGQSHSIEIPVDDGWLESSGQFLAGAAVGFTAAHLQRYGHGDANVGLEIVATRVRVNFAHDIPHPQPKDSANGPLEPIRNRRIYFRDLGWVDTPIFSRGSLSYDSAVVGPAIVDDTSSTIIVPQGWTLRRHETDALVIDCEENK